MCVCVCTHRVQNRCDEQVGSPQKLAIHCPGRTVREEPTQEETCCLSYNKYVAVPFQDADWSVSVAVIYALETPVHQLLWQILLIISRIEEKYMAQGILKKGTLPKDLSESLHLFYKLAISCIKSMKTWLMAVCRIWSRWNGFTLTRASWAALRSSRWHERRRRACRGKAGGSIWCSGNVWRSSPGVSQRRMMQDPEAVTGTWIKE